MNNYPENDSRTALMKVHEGVKHTEIVEEFILPDYLPDIKRIIRADTSPKIDGKFIAGGKIEYEGDAALHLMYLDDGNHLKTVTFTAPFSDQIEISGADDECIANLVPSPKSLNCRMQNPRRVSLRVRIDTEITVWCERSFRPELSGKLSPVGTESLTEKVNTMQLVCAGDNGLSASADLEADGALPQIGEIIKTDVDIGFYECKPADGKVLCRGDMPITVFYSAPEGENGEKESYHVIFRKLPVAEVIEAPGVTDTFECLARGKIDDVKVSVTENGFGEKRIIQLDITYRIYLNSVEKGEVLLTKDMYAPDRTVLTENMSEKFYYPARTYSLSFGQSRSDTREELGLGDAVGVYSVKAEPCVTEVKLSDDGYKLNVSGNASVSAVMQGTDGIGSCDFEFPFNVSLDAAGIPANFIYNCDTVCMNARSRLDSEKLYTDLDLQLNLMVLGENEVNVLKKAEFGEKPEEKSEPGMRFFYPAEGETLWDIGKSFGISRQKIIDSNKLSSQKLPEVLFIPR